jgi:hypothetical protein
VRELPVEELSGVLDRLGITAGWEIGDAIRAARFLAPTEPPLAAPRDARHQAFQNLVVGRLAERVFRRDQFAALEREGFLIHDYHEAGENRDYGVEMRGLELPINVKVASTLFRKAWETVGLDPDDCVPISAYKAIGASERVPDLVYVDLVDFELRERVDGFMDRLEDYLAIGWHLFSWYGGRGATKAQNEYLTAPASHAKRGTLFRMTPSDRWLRARRSSYGLSR